MAAVPLAYVLPALCYLRLEDGVIYSRNKLPALGVAIFGLTVAILGVIFLFMDLDQVNTCSHGNVMSYCIPVVSNITSNGTII